MSFDLEKARACAAFVDPKEAFLEALAEIERLRAENAGLSKAVIDIAQERDLAQAEFRAYHKAWEKGATRVKELEEARSWQITDERVRAIQWAEEMAGDCKAGDTLRAMLKGAGQ